MPVSSGTRSNDCIGVELDGDFLIDERDNSVQTVHFTLDPPSDGDSKDVNPSRIAEFDGIVLGEQPTT